MLSDRKKQIEFLRIALVIIGFALVFGAHIVQGYYNCLFGEISTTESYQTLAAQKALSGHMPLRDFAYSHMPLPPYLSGAIMEVVGYGLIHQRIVNVIVSGLSLLAIIVALRKRLGAWEPGLAIAFVAAASPFWASIQTLGTGLAFSSLFLGISFFMAITTGPFLLRTIVFSMAAAFAIGCELNLAPVVVVLCSVFMLEIEGMKKKVIVAGLTVLFVLLTLGPFLIVAGTRLYYFNWIFRYASQNIRPGLIQAMEWWQVSPAMILVFVTGLVGMPRLVKMRRFSEVLLLVAGIVGVGLPMLSSSAHGYFIAPAAPLAAACGLIAFWATQSAAGNPYKYAFWVFPAISLLYPLPALLEDEVDTEIEEVAQVLRENAPKGDILTPLPILAVAAQRNVLRGTEQGMFSAMSQKRRRAAEYLKLTTIPDLIDQVSVKSPSAIIQMTNESKWNFRWQVPSLNLQPTKLYSRYLREIHRNYTRIYRSATMEVYIPQP